MKLWSYVKLSEIVRSNTQYFVGGEVMIGFTKYFERKNTNIILFGKLHQRADLLHKTGY